ncbi:MAG: group II truncated hemoglobin [Gammaproteobacteria bacterium]|nr:group II truncated hemoglobin [Gammaproteobacteria bacterium]
MLNPESNPYDLMGGETAVRKLVDRFYDLMDTMPETYVIRQMHAKDLSGAREKLFMFLSGWLGGPPLYIKKYGHPRLRARHLPFKIDEAERDQWMMCMNQAIDEQIEDEDLKQHFKQAFYKTADFMRNQGLPNPLQM